jgi:hypothetical protein
MELLKDLSLFLERTLKNNPRKKGREEYINGQFEYPTREVNQRVLQSLCSVPYEEWKMIERMLKLGEWASPARAALARFETTVPVETLTFPYSSDWDISQQHDHSAVTLVAAQKPDPAHGSTTIPVNAFVNGAYFMFVPDNACDEEIDHIARCYHRMTYEATDDSQTHVTTVCGMDKKTLSILKPRLYGQTGTIQTTFYAVPAFHFDIKGTSLNTFVSASNTEFLLNDPYTTLPVDISAP